MITKALVILAFVLCTCDTYKVIVKVSKIIIKDKKQDEIKIINMDDRMLQYPSVALGQLTKVMSRMSYEAINLLDLHSLIVISIFLTLLNTIRYFLVSGTFS